MNNGGTGGGGGSNQNSGGGQAVTTTSQRQGQTSTSALQTVTNTATLNGSPASTSSTSQKGAVIGGVIGGLVVVLLIALIGIALLQRRKKKKLAKQRGSQPVTYAGLNASFAGVPFGTQPPHQTPAPLAPPSSSSRQHSGVNLRGGEAIRDDGSSAAWGGEPILPTYAQSQSDAMSRMTHSSAGRLDTSNATHNEVSPISSFTPQSQRDYQNNTPALTAQQTGDTMGLPRDPNDNYDVEPLAPMPRLYSRHRDTIDTVDTMGFPIERLQTQPESPIVAPRPIHPVNQNTLEIQVRREMGGVESPVLGYSAGPAVRAAGMPQRGLLNQIQTNNTSTRPKSGLSRNVSERTAASSTFAPAIVTDDELERLGVGMGRRTTPNR